MQSINPYTGAIIAEHIEHSDLALEEILDRMEHGYRSWAQTKISARTSILSKLAEVLRTRKLECAQMIAIEMGKPVKQGLQEIDKCILCCSYYRENAEHFLAPQAVKTEYPKSYVTFKPLGIVLGIMPWNFPFWQVFRFCLPTLVAGNVTLLKHASNVSGCALLIEQIFRESGFPEDSFRVLLVGSSRIEKIIRDRRVAAVTLTGSTAAGKAIASVAGSVLKKVVLELGGSDPYLILPDADIGVAAKACATSRLLNSGQSCIAAKRFIVDQQIVEPFIEALATEFGRFRIGDPLDPKTDLGPLARMDLRDELHRQVVKSVSQGAKKIVGGEISQETGAFYPATILRDLTQSMPVLAEEVFGPVAAIVTVKGVEQAIQIANSSAYGLGAAVFTSDLELGEQIASERLEAGACFVNDLVRSDPRLPFGGIKESGFGRELADFGIREFVNVKTVVVK